MTGLIVDSFAGGGGASLGIELSPLYWADAIAHCEAAERKMAMPSLFDVTEPEADEEAAVA